MLTRTTKKIIIIFLLLVFGSQTSRAQDFLVSQFYANPLYLNPAFAGTEICPRLSLGYRNQWPSIPGGFVTYMASYDQYISGISGGLGVFIASDQHGAFRKNMGSLMYSYRFRVSKNIHINAALKASFINDYLNWDELTFGNQIDPTSGFIYPTMNQAPSNANVFYADFGAGAVVYSDYFYGGVAFDHLTQPNQGFYGVGKLPMKITVHAGGLINVSSERRRTSPLGLKSPIVSPNLIYQNMWGFNYMNYGLYLDWMPIVLGAWFRHGFENVDALIFMVGIQQPSFKVGYSYDLTLSKLSGLTGGAHEVTLGIKFPCPEKKKKVKKIKCPSF